MMDPRSIFHNLSTQEVENKLFSLLQDTLHQKYGATPDEKIVLRFQEEWAAMERSKTILDVAALYELTVWLKENNHPFWMRGCAGSSFILYLLDITSGNPLPAHYHCPVCHRIQWMPGYGDGFDLPRDKCCEADQARTEPDGHDISWQIFWGFDDHVPVFDMDVPSDLEQETLARGDNHWLKKLRPTCPADNLPMGPNSVALGHLQIHCRMDRLTIHKDFHKKKIDCSCVSIALTTWQTLFDHYDFSDDCTKSRIQNIHTFADLISVYGLIRSFGTWDDETIYFNQVLGYAPSELIALRDDIFRYLLSHGFLPKDAWKGMNHTRKGLPLPVVTEEMKHAYDKWVIRRCEKRSNFHSKAHAVEYFLFQLKSLIPPSITNL